MRPGGIWDSHRPRRAWAGIRFHRDLIRSEVTRRLLAPVRRMDAVDARGGSPCCNPRTWRRGAIRANCPPRAPRDRTRDQAALVIRLRAGIARRLGRRRPRLWSSIDLAKEQAAPGSTLPKGAIISGGSKLDCRDRRFQRLRLAGHHGGPREDGGVFGGVRQIARQRLPSRRQVLHHVEFLNAGTAGGHGPRLPGCTRWNCCNLAVAYLKSYLTGRGLDVEIVNFFKHRKGPPWQRCCGMAPGPWAITRRSMWRATRSSRSCASFASNSPERRSSRAAPISSTSAAPTGFSRRSYCSTASAPTSMST